MKLVTLIAVLLLPLRVLAGGSSQVSSVPDSSGIVTPNIATDGIRTSRVGRTAAGETVVCPLTMKYSYGADTCTDTNDRPAWVWLHQLVPAGKTYVGFRIVSQGSGFLYEVYWK